MATDSSRTSAYMIRGGAPGRERLRVLARAMRPTTTALLDRVGIPPGARCLDVGCGGGDVTLELAARAGAGGHVVGVDLDDAKLELARAEAAERGVEVEYRVADVTRNDVGAGFDVVYLRFVLTHLPDPGGACRRLHDAVASGGCIVVEDIDMRASFCFPDSPAHDRSVEIYRATAHARGGDPDIGPRLPCLLLEAGFEHAGVTAVQPAGIAVGGVEADIKAIPALTLENIAQTAIAEGVSDPDEVEEVGQALRRLAGNPHVVIGLPRIVQVWARRPQSS
jgi:SAM-dependent methyltransferase